MGKKGEERNFNKSLKGRSRQDSSPRRTKMVAYSYSRSLQLLCTVGGNQA